MIAVLEAADKLAAQVQTADTIGEALAAAGGENPPAWVSVYRDQIEAIQVASVTLECLLRGVSP